MIHYIETIVTCKSINAIDIYCLAIEKFMKTSLLTNKKPINAPMTSIYLKQNNPSFMTIEHRLRKSINIIIKQNKHSRLNDNLKTAEAPTHYNLF